MTVALLDVGLDGAAVAVLGVATVVDLRARRIPDWLTLPALALAPVALLATGLIGVGLMVLRRAPRELHRRSR